MKEPLENLLPRKNIAIAVDSTNKTAFGDLNEIKKILLANGLDVIVFTDGKIDDDSVKKFDFLFDGFSFYKAGTLSSISIWQWVKKNLPFKNFIFSFVYYFQLKRWYNSALKLNKVKPIDGAIIPSERFLRGMPAFIKFCENNNIPIAVWQAGVNTQQFNYTSYRKDNFNYFYKNPMNFVVNFGFAKNRMEFENSTICFFPWQVVIPLRVAGCLPSDPWVEGNSFSKIHFVQTASEKQYFEKIGSTAQISVVGFPRDRKIIESYNHCDKQENNILVCLPQFYEHGLKTKEESIRFIEELCEVLTSKFVGFKIIANLHPKMSYEDYSFIEKYGFELSLADVCQLIPTVRHLICFFPSVLRYSDFINLNSSLIGDSNNGYLYSENTQVFVDLNEFSTATVHLSEFDDLKLPNKDLHFQNKFFYTFKNEFILK